MALDPTVIALVGTLCGGIGLKVVEHWLGKSKAKVDEATKIREELRVELNSLKDEGRNLESEVDKWKKEYYDLRDKYSELNATHKMVLERIKNEAEIAAKAAAEAAAALELEKEK